MNAIASSFLIVALAACVWGVICNFRTFRQRQTIIRQLGNIQSMDDLTRWERSFKAVPYEKHLVMLFLFKDLMPLYRDWRS